MPLPWPEIRDKAIAFSREWQDAERVAFLFELYRKDTSFLPIESKARKLRARKMKLKKP